MHYNNVNALYSVNVNRDSQSLETFINIDPVSRSSVPFVSLNYNFIF
jgi:hypothetical protein